MNGPSLPGGPFLFYEKKRARIHDSGGRWTVLAMVKTGPGTKKGFPVSANT